MPKASWHQGTRSGAIIRKDSEKQSPKTRMWTVRNTATGQFATKTGGPYKGVRREN